MPDLNREKTALGCPGCTPVDVDNRPCEPRNAGFCLAARAKAAGWKRGACAGCKLLADGLPCQSGDARVCAVAWSRNKPHA